MAIIGSDGLADGQTPASPSRKASELAFTLTFLSVSAIATVGWLYVLAEGAMTVTDWLFF